MNKPVLRKRTQLDENIDKVLAMMLDTPIDTPEYDDLIGKLERLKALRSEDRGKVSADTLVNAGTQLLSVAAVVKHEQFNVVTSKAWDLLMRRKTA